MKRIYVETLVRFDLEGNMRPIAIVWEDGRRFEVQRVLSIKRRVSQTDGSGNLRFTCRIEGYERYLFFEDKKYGEVVGGKWFVEAESE